MKLVTLIGSLIGIGLAAWLLERYGIGRIVELLSHAGWLGLSTVIAFHLVQIALSALGWRVVCGPGVPRLSLRRFMVLRWIREAVNNLLPVAQIGGEFVAARLMRQRGVKLAPAIAGTVADLTLEMVTQIIFTLLGLLLLWQTVSDNGITGYVVSGLLVATILVACLFGAVSFGLAGAIERGLIKLGRLLGWAGMAEIEGLHAALLGCYRVRSRVALAATSHFLSWSLGAIEVCLALHFLGRDVGIGQGLVIESLGQALKAVGFAVPGALGVQEGGYIVICQAFGLSPEIAIALSLIKRLREVVFGVPALLAWHRTEAQAVTARMESIPGASP